VPDVDLAIVGSGFGGSILAMVARRLGLRVALIERGRHPRFAIGESSSPLAGILIEQLADRYDLPHLKPLAAVRRRGSAPYPDVVCASSAASPTSSTRPGARLPAAADRSNHSAGGGEPARRDLRHALAAVRRGRLPGTRGGGARRRVRRRGAAGVAGMECRGACPCWAGSAGGRRFVSARAGVIDASRAARLSQPGASR
jgi:glycine/D-amino acid oxidase-like deaminating enzyme